MYKQFRLAGLEVEASHGQFLNEVSLIQIFVSASYHQHHIINIAVSIIIVSIICVQVKRSEEEADSWAVAPSKIPVGAFRL